MVSQKMQSKYEILTDDGWSDFHGVRKQTAIGYVKIVLDTEETLECSLDHKIMCGNSFKEAKDLNIGDTVNTLNGRSKITQYYITKDENIAVYDALHVSKNNKYVTNNIISHNCEFVGSSGTLISGAKLKTLVHQRPIFENENIKQYKKPVKDHIYIMTVDVSRGKGLDYSTFSIFDATTMPCEQVCTFRDNFIGPADYASVIYRMATIYNNAQVLVEINDIGGQVADTLFFDFGYEEVIYTANNGRSGKQVSGGFGKSTDRGIRTTKTVKSVGCNILKMLVEQEQLILNDFETIAELYTFSRKANSYEAESGKHDDMVATLFLFAWLSDQAYFKDITDINILTRLREKTEQEITDDLLPFGFINDGLGEYEDDSVSRIANW
jgi:hypothetical protein